LIANAVNAALINNNFFIFTSFRHGRNVSMHHRTAIKRNPMHPFKKEEAKMRSIPILLAVLAISVPAAAEGWQEYSYPEYGISVTFPANPLIETTTYRAVDGRSVPARVYSVRQENGEFKLTVADLASTGLDEKSVIDHAIKTLSRSATVKLNIPARIYQVYGRQLTLEGADGSRSMVAMFDFMDRLYQIEATVPPGGSEFELTRFQQSLVFEPGISNRSPEEIRAIRAACPGNPAGLDDPRCQGRR
jgi:hypothetical protein